jgi:phage-related minor tail protein
MADQQIVIDIEARTAQAMQKLRAMGKMMRAQSAAMATSMQGVQEQLQALGQGKGFDMPEISGRAEAMEAFDKQTKKVNTNMNTLAAQGMVAAESMESAGSKGKKAGRGISNSFDEAALGVMFFGMQIQRIFGGIIRSGISTFNKVHNQLESTTTATNRLSGAWKFLKFNIGEAMQPLMAFLFPIVEGIARWVEEHEKLTRWILITGAAVGALLMAYGSLKLGIGAVIDMFGKFTTLIQPLMQAVASLGGVFSGVVATIGAIIAVFIAIGAAIATNKTVWDSFNNDVLGPIWENFKSLLKTLGLGNVNLNDILWALKAAADVVATGFAVIGAIVIAVFGSAIQVAISGISSFISALQGLWDSLKSVIKLLQSFWNFLTGDTTKAQEQYTKAVEKGKEAMENFKDTYNEIVSVDDEIKKQFEFVSDTVTGLKEQGGLLQTNSFGNAKNVATKKETTKEDKDVKKKQDKQIEEQKKTRQSINQLNGTMMQAFKQQSGLSESRIQEIMNGANTKR